MGQPVVHWELWSKQPASVAAFYGEVFGWSIQHLPELNYRMVQTGGEGGINGGIMSPQEGPWPGNMALYIRVDDLDAYAARIRAAGGTIVVDKQPIPGMGTLSLFADPEGRVLGMWSEA